MKLIICFVALLLSFGSPVMAADDVAAAQGIIRAQLDALDRDDAAGAYAHASPDIRGLFPEPDSFMAMVRRNYAAVHHHKSFEFGDSRAAAGRVIQEVRIVDTDGVPWQAIYTLEQQPDGSFKITGCTLKAVGTPA
ncbi:MAG: hypothetical protein JWP21_3193 [Tardiphaga sp.]|nr:hypothetical protein [Tardiphaga sp.]